MSASNDRKRVACIATILRSTFLQFPPQGNASFEKFFAGGKHGFLLGGPPVEWWYPAARERAEKDLSRIIIAEGDLASLTIEGCTETLREVLRSICLRPEFFFRQKVLGRESKCLMDCISKPIREFADDFFHLIRKACLSSVSERLLVLPVMPRLRGLSFYIHSHDVGLVGKADEEAWKKLFGEAFPSANWDAANFQFRGAKDVLGKEEFFYLAVAKNTGAADWCLKNSTSNLRVLISVLMAHFLDVQQKPLQTVIAPPPDTWIQFPAARSSESWHASHGVAIAPYLGFERVVDEFVVEKVRLWYGSASSLNEDLSSRLEKAAYFANLAMHADELVNYIFYFVALDALFGERMNVERLVFRGIAKLVPELGNRSRWLYDLRNELVHGGCRSIKEWKEYERYRDHFGTEPARDIEAVSLKCVMRYPGAPI